MSSYLQDILSAYTDEYKLLESNNENNPLIDGISFNSKSIKPGDLFVCLVGENFDAHNFIDDAISNGAKAILAQKMLENIPVPVIVVEDTQVAMAKISNIYYNDPSLKMRLIGITGTNGKTTVTHLVEKILEEAKKPCGLIGTLGYRMKSSDSYADSKHTTPQSPDLQKYLHEMVNMKFDYTVMEVSSHALDLHRVLGCHFAVGLITNITQDHLDFHVTMDNYAQAKAKLFEQLNESKTPDKFAIINNDDPMAACFKEKICTDVHILTYGLTDSADIQAKDIKHALDGTTFTCVTPDETFKVNLKLKGQFSVYNALSAISVAIAEKIPVETICKALEQVENIPGRFEAVSDTPLTIVDYAHTPDGLENVLKAARELVPEGSKLITVFGCGGDRDPTKRPKMAAFAEELSDKIVVTSDNPRTEDPQQIISDILTGIKNLDSDYVKVEIDRAFAIEQAIKWADDSDVVVVAGKGHEDYQILGNKTIHFDDREVVKDIIEKLKTVKTGG